MEEVQTKSDKTAKRVVRPPSDKNFILAMLSPTFILFFAGIAIPLIMAIYLSFISSSGGNLFGNPNNFQNFKDFIFPKRRYTRTFYRYTYQTIIIVVLTLILEFGLGLTFALLLNRKFRGRGLARATLLIPWALPTVVSATMFLEIFAPINNFGVINNLIDMFGGTPYFFYGDPLENVGSNTVPVFVPSFPFFEMSDNIEVRYEFALLTLIFVEVWKTTPFVALLILAALQIVPEDLYKAADIEGANSWEKFRHITWPIIKGPASIAMLFRAIDAVRIYDSAVIFGDPSVQSITVVSVNAWRQGNFGVSSAIALFELLLIVMFALLIFKGNKFSYFGASLVFFLLFNRFLVFGIMIYALILVIYFVNRNWSQREGNKTTIEFEPRSLQSINIRRRINFTGFFFGMTFLILFCIAPFLWILNRSFRNPCLSVNEDQGCTDPSRPQNDFELIPEDKSFQSYKIVLSGTEADLTGALINGFILAGLTAIIVVILGSFVAMILAKYEVKFSRMLVLMIFSMSSLPPIIVIIPYLVQINWLKSKGYDLTGYEFITINGVGYPGPLFPLILPYVAFSLPLGVFLLRSFFAEIPNELILAAKVDGASNFQIYRKIMLPLTKPGIFTTAMMVFIFAWNELLFARIFLTPTPDYWTVPLSIVQFNKSSSELTGIPWVPNLVLTAASIVATLPLIIMVLIFQKHIIKGITAGAVKG